MSASIFTEAWAGVYLQVVISIFVFVLGVPALILQFLTPEDLSKVYKLSDRSWLYWGLATVSLSILTAWLLIWWLHPIQGSVESTSLALPKLDLPFIGSLNNILSQGLIANGLVSFTFLLGFITLLISFSYLWRDPNTQRQKIVSRQVNVLVKKFSRTGTLADANLYIINLLGTNSPPGRQKEIILSGLQDLSNGMINSQLYDGRQFEQFFHVLNETLRTSSPDNLIHGFEILRTIMFELGQRTFQQALDYHLSFSELKNIASGLIKANRFDRIDEVIDLSAQLASDNLYLVLDLLKFLGSESLKQSAWQTATKTLTRSETLLLEMNPITQQARVIYLGLIAAFWKYGPSAQRRARLSLKKFPFEPSLKECLLQARDYHYNNADFLTSDDLEAALITGLKNERKYKNACISFFLKR